MNGALNSSSIHGTQFADFNRKYQIVLSSCRLLTEAQSALDRSITDFVSVAQALDPDVNVQAFAMEAGQGSIPPRTVVSRTPSKGGKRTKVTNLSSPTTGTADVRTSTQSAAPALLTQAEPRSDTELVGESSSSSIIPGKKQKKIRDPDLPKRPMSAFFLFQNAVRNSVKSAMPEESKGAEIQKAISEKWKELDDESRQPYNEKYENELQDYEARLATYKQDHGLPQRPKSSSTRSDVKNRTPVKTNQANDDDAAAASIVSQVTDPKVIAEAQKTSKKRARTTELEGQKVVKSPRKSEKASDEKKEKKQRKKSVSNVQ